MILTCPDCATRYFVGDDAVPPQGRTVRCAACAAEWRAAPEAPDTLTLAPASTPGAIAPEAKPAPVSSVLRAKARAKKETRAAAAVGVVWAALGVAMAAVLGLAVLFRVDVVRLWPRTAGAYAAVKLPVNPVGLAPEGVQGGPGLQNGRAVLVVTGAVRNVTTSARPDAALKVSLFDKAGRRLAVQAVRPPGGAIGPGEARAFAATFVDPPLAAAEFGVDFAFDTPPAPPPAAPRAAHGTLGHPPGVTGAASEAPRATAIAVPLEHVPQAAPLPADSPYALHVTPPHG